MGILMSQKHFVISDAWKRFGKPRAGFQTWLWLQKKIFLQPLDNCCIRLQKYLLLLYFWILAQSISLLHLMSLLLLGFCTSFDKHLNLWRGRSESCGGLIVLNSLITVFLFLAENHMVWSFTFNWKGTSSRRLHVSLIPWWTVSV